MDLANDYDDVKMRMRICEDGKSAVTEILPIEYFADIDATPGASRTAHGQTASNSFAFVPRGT